MGLLINVYMHVRKVHYFLHDSKYSRIIQSIHRVYSSHNPLNDKANYYSSIRNQRKYQPCRIF
jgi:hypothetical protein